LISADLKQIAERLINPAKAIILYDHRFRRWFFFEKFQIKTGYLNHIVRLAFCRSTKKEKMNRIVKSFVHSSPEKGEE
jgi:hypothetical protein